MPTGKVKRAYFWVDIGYPIYNVHAAEMLTWCEEQFGSQTLPYIRGWLYFAPKERIYFRNEEDRTAFMLQWQDKLITKY